MSTNCQIWHLSIYLEWGSGGRLRSREIEEKGTKSERGPDVPATILRCTAPRLGYRRAKRERGPLKSGTSVIYLPATEDPDLITILDDVPPKRISFKEFPLAESVVY